jgi:superfamily I DNA/RNA helicase
VRTAGRPPVLVEATDPVGAAAAHAGRLAGEYASVGVVAPAELHAALGAALDGAGVEFSTRELDAPVTLLAPPAAKGLEFDAVVVVEPALVAGGDASGARLLYVALTRAVQELVVAHSRPLPAPLGHP